MTSKEIESPLQEFPKIRADAVDVVNARLRQDPTLLRKTKAVLHPDERAFIEKVKQLTGAGANPDATTAALGSAVLTSLYVEESMLTDNETVTTIGQPAIDGVHARLDSEPTLMHRIEAQMFGLNPDFRLAVGNMAQLTTHGDLDTVITNASALSALIVGESLHEDLGLDGRNITPLTSAHPQV